MANFSIAAPIPEILHYDLGTFPGERRAITLTVKVFPRSAVSYPLRETVPGRLDQPDAVLVNVADQEGGGAVAVVLVQKDGHVHVDNVAGLESARIRDAVAYAVID